MKYKITLQGKVYEIEVEEGNAMLLDEYEAKAPAVSKQEVKQAAQQPSADANKQTASAADGTEVTAPLPGNIMTIKVSEGQKVKAGEVLLIIEAMKMENEVLAPKDGVVKQILVSKGSAVATGNLLLVM